MDKGTISCTVDGCNKKIYVDSTSAKEDHKKWVEGLFVKFNVDNFDKLHAIYKCRSCLKKERLGIPTQVKSVEKQEKQEVQQVIISTEPQTESFVQTENLSKLVPQSCSKYIPRSINGINDIEMMERAYQNKIPLL